MRTSTRLIVHAHNHAHEKTAINGNPPGDRRMDEESMKKGELDNNDNGANPTCAETIVLGSSLQLSMAGELYKQLQSLTGTRGDIVINGAGVEYADTSALQLLTAFVRHVQANGARVCWEQPADALLRGAMRLGLNTHLCLENAQKGATGNQ